MSPKHQKVTTYTLKEDGAVQIVANSYFEDLSHTHIEIEKQLPVTRQTVLSEVLNCLEYITRDKSVEVNIKVKAKNGEPTLLIKRWTTSKQDFPRQ